jgi:hypothetical protein
MEEKGVESMTRSYNPLVIGRSEYPFFIDQE